MTIHMPWALALIVLAVLPFMWQRPRVLFRFSSFIAAPTSQFSRALFFLFRTVAAMLIVSMAFGIADIRLHGVLLHGIRWGVQTVFVRDRSGSMTSENLLTEEGTEITKMAAATNEIKRLIIARPGDQYGLIDFGDVVITRSHLTFRKDQIIALLEVPPSELGGTVIGRPLERAIGLFPYKRSLNAKAIILVSDGAGEVSNSKDLARWMEELNIVFFWVFIGAGRDWSYAQQYMAEFITDLGPRARVFRVDKAGGLKRAMGEIRALQRGIIRYPIEIAEYPLSPFFYGTALACFVILGIFVLLELMVKPRKEGIP